MKRLKEDLIPAFWEAMKDRGILTFEEVEEALLTPWQAFRDGTDTGYFPMFRFQHLGCFRVPLGRARCIKRDMDSRVGHETGWRRERHKRLADMLGTYLDRIDVKGRTEDEDSGDAEEDDD